jgi:hypothetical protein
MVSQPSKWSTVAKDGAAQGPGPTNQSATAATPAAMAELYAQPVTDDSRKRKQHGYEKTGPEKKTKLHQGKNNGEMSVADRRAEQKKTLDTWFDKPRGADFPSASTEIGDMNGLKKAILVVRSGKAAWSMVFDVRVKLEMYSQAPAMKIIFNDGDEADVGTFRAHDFSVPDQEDAAAPPLPRFQWAKIRMDLGPENDQKASFDEWNNIFSERFYCPVQQKMLEHIIGWGTSQDGKFSAVHLLGFHHKGAFFFDKRSPPADVNSSEAGRKEAKLNKLEELLNSGVVYTTLIRRGKEQFDVVDDHWMKRVVYAAENGPYPFYREHVGKVTGRLFEQWNKRPDTSVPRQEWMRKVKTSPNAMEFATHPAQRSYGTPREMEMAFSLGVVGEMMWERVSMQTYFVDRVKHVARVLDRSGAHVQLGIAVEKFDDVQMPLVGVGSKMMVTICPIRVKDGENPRTAPLTDGQNFPALPAKPVASSAGPVASSAGPVASSAAATTAPEQPFQQAKSKRHNNDIPAPIYGWAANKKYEARCIDIESSQDFVIGFVFEDVRERKAFNKGEHLDVSIHMKQNSLSSLRQLQAIGRLCSKWESPSEQMMQEFIMGYGQQIVSTTIDQEYRPQLSLAEQRALQSSYERLNTVLNGPQKETFKAIFHSTKNFMTVIEGIPGAGKTDVMANLGTMFAQYGIRTLLTAPSNTAARELMVKLSQALDELYKIEPAYRNILDVVFVPTSAATKDDLQQFGIEQISSDMVAEGSASTGDAVVDNYKLWTRILTGYEYQATNDPNADAKDQADARKWLKWRQTISQGGSVSNKDRKKFVEGIKTMATKVLSPKGKVRIVVSTCNSAALLEDYHYAPIASLVDEAASASMTDALIPLTLGSRFNVLAGDDAQLRPVVRSMGHSEYAATFGLSMYARFYGHPLANTVRLKINYRMHENIADLPGILTYTFMACAQNTSVESDTFRWYKEWYESQNGGKYRLARRDPAYGNTKDESRIRRLFINVKGGKSAPKKGGSSKRNFANINAIIDYFISLIMHERVDASIPQLDTDKITILTPYKEEVAELTTQLRRRVTAIWPRFRRFPRFRTIDGTQGSENEIVILGLTPADRHNGSVIGFLKEWNRMNVALTRSKSVLTIFGNLDYWRSQLKVIGHANNCKNFAYMVVDLLDRGDIIDVDGINRVTRSLAEAKTNNWTVGIEDTPADKSKLTAKGRAVMKEYKTPEQRDAYERALLAELQAKRNEAAVHKQRLLAGEQYDLPFIQAGTYMENAQRIAEIEAQEEAHALRDSGLVSLFEEMSGLSNSAMDTDKGKSKAVAEDSTMDDEVQEQLNADNGKGKAVAEGSSC